MQVNVRLSSNAQLPPDVRIGPGDHTYKCSNVLSRLVAGLVSLFTYSSTEVYQLSIGTLAGALAVAPIATRTNCLAES